MTKIVYLNTRLALRLPLALALLLMVASISIAQKPQRAAASPPQPPVKQESPQIEKMAPAEVNRGTRVIFTGRDFPDKRENITVYIDGKALGNPNGLRINPDKTGSFSFAIPSNDLELGKHYVKVEFKQSDGFTIPIAPNDPAGGEFIVYGNVGKTPPKITAISPLTSYPEKKLFGFEIIGEGFSTRGRDNILFREGNTDLDVCWDDDDKTCDKPNAAHGKVESDGRKIILTRIPKEYCGISKIGVRQGDLKSQPVGVTLSSVEKDTPIVASLVGFVVLFGLVIWLTGRSLEKTSIAGKSHWLGAALLLDRETDTYSLSRLQFFLWTGAAVLGYLYLAVSRSLVQGRLEFVDVPEGLPAIILISASTTVIAQGITSAKGPKGAGPVHPSAADLISSGGIVAPERFQFFVWTIIGVLTFLFLVALQDPGTIKDLPKVPSGFMELMGVSSAGYLGGKLVRKPGPVIDEIIATLGSLEFRIRGRNLSQDASFRIGDEDLTSDKIMSSDKTKPGKPELVEPDTESNLPNMAKALRFILNEPKPEWLAPGARLTIINPDGQMASWPYSLTAQTDVADTEDTDGCDVTVGDPTLDEDLPASEGGVA